MQNAYYKTITIKDKESCMAKALTDGVLSQDKNSFLYFKNWEYVFTQREVDQFRNIFTGKYLVDYQKKGV